METMQGRNKVATMKMERMEGPAGGGQVEQQWQQAAEGHGARSTKGPRRGGREHGKDREGGCAQMCRTSSKER